MLKTVSRLQRSRVGRRLLFAVHWPLHHGWQGGSAFAYDSKAYCPICKAVWDELESDPNFMRGVQEGGADIAAGRWYQLDKETGETHPNPDWPKDGPQPTHS